MRFIKLFFISIIVLFCVLLAISLAIPSHIRISRAINIGAPKKKVFNAINDLKAWDSWNHFTSQSSLTNKIFSDPSSGYGALMKADQLSIIITDSKPDSIKTNWDQLNAKRFDGGFNLYQLRQDSVTVQFYFDFHFKWYPWEKLTSLLYEKQLGPVMEESLTGLKQILENSK
jgi:ribosome-associated toxin RatA of RatAB toxin-antitoxin module